MTSWSDNSVSLNLPNNSCRKIFFIFLGGGWIKAIFNLHTGCTWKHHVFGVCCQVFCAFLSQYCYESGAPKGNFCTVLNLTGMS